MKELKQKAYTVLRKSESFFKTDMVYLAKGGFWLSFGQLFSSIATFLLAIIFAHTVSKDLYGNYKYLISITGVLSIFTLKGMDSAIIQAVAAGKEGSFKRVIRIKILAGLIGSFIAIIAAIYYFQQGNMLLAGGFVIAGLFTAFMDPLFLYDSFLQGKQRFKESTLYSLISQISFSVVIGVTVILTKNLYAIVFVYFAIWTLVRFIIYRRVIGNNSFNTQTDPKTVSYGMHSSVINSIAIVTGSIDSILIFHYLGASSLAIYAFALAPVIQIKTLADKIPTLAIPRFAQREVKDLEQSLGKRMTILATIGVIITLAYIIFAPLFYKILFPQYLDSVIYSQVFSLMLVVYLPYVVISAALGAKLTHIPKNLLYLWNIPNVVMTVSVIFLVINFGIMGVILAKIISVVASALVGFYIWNRVKRDASQNLHLE